MKSKFFQQKNHKAFRESRKIIFFCHKFSVINFDWQAPFSLVDQIISKNLVETHLFRQTECKREQKNERKTNEKRLSNHSINVFFLYTTRQFLEKKKKIYCRF